MPVSEEEMRQIIAEVERRMRGHTFQTATVSAYREERLMAVVAPDGGGETIEAINIVGFTLVPGDRVVLAFDPPAGVYVIGLFTAQGGDCDPLAVGATVSVIEGGLSYFDDFAVGDDVAVSVSNGLQLSRSGIWHIHANIQGSHSFFTDTATWAGLDIQYGVGCQVTFAIPIAVDPGDGTFAGSGSVVFEMPGNGFPASVRITDPKGFLGGANSLSVARLGAIHEDCTSSDEVCQSA